MAQAEQWFDTSPDTQDGAPGLGDLLRQADRLCFLLDVSCDRHRPCGWPDRPCPFCRAVDEWRATRRRWAERAAEDRRPYAVP